MKILYGVQATGQGHISRARAMAEAFSKRPDVEVTWLFSGRKRDKLFDMEPFGDYLHRRGLSFVTRAGSIDHLATLFSNNLFRCWRDARELHVDHYDVIVTDFEPVTALAGRLAGKQTIGIGHQYAFGPGTPRRGESLVSRFIMRWFAPVDIPLGLHWQPYAANVLPPILDLPPLELAREPYILVYLPFEDQDVVTQLLQRFPQHRFIQYAPGLPPGQRGNVERHTANIDGFKRHLFRAGGVICNSGFELISECLQLRKPVLTKPLAGQFEQLSNALALEQAGLAVVTDSLSYTALEPWLASPPVPQRVSFADVPAALAQWLARGEFGEIGPMSESLWGASRVGFSPWNASLPAERARIPIPCSRTR